MFGREKHRHKEEHEKVSTMMDTVKAAIMIVVFVIVALVGGFILGKLANRKPKQPDITSDYIENRIETVSELTTAEMKYRGVVHFSEGEIPLLTRKHFNMIYDAEVRVGIDMDEVTVDVTDEKVTVTLPKSAVQGQVNVLPDSLRFYDEQNALFNQKENEDVQQALIKAQEDAELASNVEGIREKADAHARELIRTLLGPEIIGERQLEIKSEK